MKREIRCVVGIQRIRNKNVSFVSYNRALFFGQNNYIIWLHTCGNVELYITDKGTII